MDIDEEIRRLECAIAGAHQVLDEARRSGDAVRETTRGESGCVTVTFNGAFSIHNGWEIAELQDEVNMACVGMDVWGYIVPLVNGHEEQTFAIILSRSPR